MLNNVVLMGRLTKDAELRYTNSNMAYCNFTLAVNRRVKKDSQQQADFITCKAFSKTAESLAKFCEKGRQIAVMGRIQTGSYDNKEGQKIYTTDVIVDSFYFADAKKTTTNNVEYATQDEVIESMSTDALPF
jgi:single-strand DNA-binding protein